MGEFLDQPVRLSPSLRKGNAGITPDNYQILPPSSNHIYTRATYELFAAWEQLPPDEQKVAVAHELLEKMNSASGKKRQDKEEKRYRRLVQFIAQNTES